VLSGGTTTPEGRVDIAAGGAARLPLGRLDAAREPDQGLGFLQPGGISPLLSAGLPLASRTDLGLLASGAAFQARIRHGFRLSEEVALLGAVAPFLGWLPLRDPERRDLKGGGLRAGAELPWVMAISLGGLYEAWAGVRAGVEHDRGSLEGTNETIELSGTGFRAGALLGVGLGFRRLHALLEIAADHEWWWLAGDPGSWLLSGFSLTPAFALRLRI
jgi:hypothetical protein